MAGRYVAECLPRLSFVDDSFDPALSSHFLSLYSDQLSAEFHRSAFVEMLRLAQEERLFPLIAMDGGFPPHVQPVMRELRSRGLVPELVTTDFEFQNGGNQFMRVRRG